MFDHHLRRWPNIQPTSYLLDLPIDGEVLPGVHHFHNNFIAGSHSGLHQNLYRGADLYQTLRADSSMHHTVVIIRGGHTQSQVTLHHVGICVPIRHYKAGTKVADHLFSHGYYTLYTSGIHRFTVLIQRHHHTSIQSPTTCASINHTSAMLAHYPYYASLLVKLR